MAHASCELRDVMEWLGTRPPPQPLRRAVATSMPDASEVGMTQSAWEAWFCQVAALCMQQASPGCPTVFLQTDRKVAGTWQSKAALLHGVAADLHVPLVWHKIVLRRDAGKVDLHRPGYSHMLAYGTCRPGQATPDVVPPSGRLGRNAWPLAAAHTALQLCHRAGATTLLNPCSGWGTLLWLGSQDYSMDCYGCDNDPEQVMAARERLALPVTG
jgi:hypothetical protein